MICIMMRTIGEVTFEGGVNMSEGYDYDIPCDRLGIPCIPLSQILEEKGVDLEGIHISFAHPDGYHALLKQAYGIQKMSGDDAISYIRRYFTNKHIHKKTGQGIRSLKNGQTYFASVHFPADLSEEEQEQKESELRLALSGIKHIGAVLGGAGDVGDATRGITGRVALTLASRDAVTDHTLELSDNCEYHALDYYILLVTPTCFYEPYADEETTTLYVPGGRIRELLRKSGLIETDEDGNEEEGLICTNAYISDGIKRLLPVPLSDAVVKLDKTQMRCRLSPGRDPHRSEQILMLQNSYTGDMQSNLLEHVKPETERIESLTRGKTDALSAGQTFRGIIYGTDEQIRRIADFFMDDPVVELGFLSEEGFGEGCVFVERAREKLLPASIMANHFDLCCVSNTLILNDAGMSATDADDLLQEIEYVLDMPGVFEIESKYTGIYKDYDVNIRWGREGSVDRCISKGSALRIRTRDGKPVDISPIVHAFIGERTADGWGEIVAFPAREGYYRLAKAKDPALYAMTLPDSFRTLKLSSYLVDGVITEMVKSRIEGLAAVDSEEYRKGIPVEELLPEVILEMYRGMYDPGLLMKTLRKWYEEALKK